LLLQSAPLPPPEPATNGLLSVWKDAGGRLTVAIRTEPRRVDQNKRETEKSESGSLDLFIALIFHIIHPDIVIIIVLYPF